VIRFRPAAARELLAEVRYYDEHYPGRGQRFAAAVELVLQTVERFPDAFPIVYAPELRSAKVERFPYRVVYVVVDGNIDILAVAHAKRRPSYWRRRRR
jgi:toxin ParE1/3/4